MALWAAHGKDDGGHVTHLMRFKLRLESPGYDSLLER